MSDVPLTEVARAVGVSPGTLRRWVREGIVPLRDGRWSRSAVTHAGIVARLRDRGHSLDDLRQAARSGRLAYGYMEELLPASGERMTLQDAAERAGLEPALVERIWLS